MYRNAMLAGLAAAVAVAVASPAPAGLTDANKLVLTGQIAKRDLGGPTLAPSEPHAGGQSQTHIHNYGDLDRACSRWTDHCRTCTRGSDGAPLCSNIGIACQPKQVECITR